MDGQLVCGYDDWVRVIKEGDCFCAWVRIEFGPSGGEFNRCIWRVGERVLNRCTGWVGKSVIRICSVC